MPENAIDHPVSRYALDVIEGERIAGPLVRMACERHLLDLEEGAARGLVFDVAAANRVIRFARLLTHVKGDLGGKPIDLEPWQVFHVGSVYGWRNAATGLRRFRTSYAQVAKKNGKTTGTAVPLCYSMLFDNEAGPEGYCVATSRDQAGILFKALKEMIRASPSLSQLMSVWQSSITAAATNATIKALSRESGTADGINPHFTALDELHRWADRDLFDIVTKSSAARSQPVTWAITTAGDNMASICGEMRTYGEKVLRGDVADDRFFAYIAEPPEDCDPGDPLAWAMANPNLGVSVTEETIADFYKSATAIQGQMPGFRRFHLNLFTEGAQTWIARDVWDGAGQAQPFDVEQLFGRPAWAAFDLSRTTDLTSVALAVPVDRLLYLVSYSFIAEGPKGFLARAQQDNRDYIAWRDAGWLEVHRGGQIDEDAVIRRLRWIKEKFDLQECAYDPWNSRYVAAQLDKMRFPLFEHRQGLASMSAPTKRFETAVMEGRLRHGGNPVLAWAVGNVMLDQDASENVKPSKKRSAGRIDPAVAAIMAVGRAEYGREKRKAKEVLIV